MFDNNILDKHCNKLISHGLQFGYMKGASINCIMYCSITGREDDPQCKDCGYNNQDVNHLFDCPAHPTVMSPTKLWSMPADTIGEFAYLDPERLD